MSAPKVDVLASLREQLETAEKLSSADASHYTEASRQFWVERAAEIRAAIANIGPQS